MKKRAENTIRFNDGNDFMTKLHEILDYTYKSKHFRIVVKVVIIHSSHFSLE